jgi:hypothetical protein
MSESFQSFVEQRLPFQGLAAWSARLADGALSSQCYGDWLNSPQVEQTLASLVLAAENLGQQGIQPARLCWVFEHMRIHLGLGPGGVCLAFFVENRPGLARDALDNLLDEFNALPQG